MRKNESPGFGRRNGLVLLTTAALSGAAAAAGWRVSATAAASEEPESIPAPAGTLVADWSLAALQAITAETGYRDPLAASRTLAMLHLAMHDAANVAAARYAPWLPISPGQGGDPAVAAAVAAHEVLRTACPGQREALRFTLQKTLLEAGRGEAVEQAIVLGATVAATMLTARADDGADRTERYGTLSHVGAYRHTPGNGFVLAPHWATLRPFALQSPRQFRSPAPPSVESTAYARAFEEVKTLGGRASARRSAEQTQIAHLWQESPGIAWNRIARSVAEARGLDLWDAARLFALANMALADGCVAAWDSAMQHDFWRPVTAIRMAAEDFNPSTTADPGWEPLLPTPPVQGHPSAPAALGSAAATVLAGVLGDATPFALASGTALPEAPQRRFPGFAAAAREQAEAQILAGADFRFATEAGLEMGRRIGRSVLANQLRPLDEGRRAA
ncbi:vanadium-dependent haloperoxidase [Roseomonas sp. AR75]|uniref:vanadium-dependent haloperoxidase n=1 Tax=Roseomonas sp. AR75 TaxID=2562311 RepID=UPI0010C082B6|nr:vanadium-dependent haloperoxidase [Roseomonas sp. AR75]